MSYLAIVHASLWLEIPADEHAGARAAMRAVMELASLSSSPQVKELAGARSPNSYRLRFGRYRILFVLFPEAGGASFTTAFLKRRGSDYDPATALHDSRVRAHE